MKRVGIDETELKAFRETLPHDIRYESFSILGVSYSVPTALYLIQKYNFEQETLDVKTWANVMGMAGERNDDPYAFNLINGVSDSDAMKDNINPEIPVILVDHAFGRGKEKKTIRLLMDGNKRLRKAFLTGMEKIKAYHIPEKYVGLVLRY
jgi:hypothetical protein